MGPAHGSPTCSVQTNAGNRPVREKETFMNIERTIIMTGAAAPVAGSLLLAGDQPTLVVGPLAPTPSGSADATELCELVSQYGWQTVWLCGDAHQQSD